MTYFVRRHFGFRGALRIHRVALGWDLLRAPANIALALPHLIKLTVTEALRRLGALRLSAWLERLPTQLVTDVEREVDWLIWTELLELPYDDGRRRSDRDAFAETLMARPEVARALAAIEDAVAGRRNDPAFRKRLEENLVRYTGARNAAAEIATALASAGTGSLVIQQVTPTAMTLGPSLAALIAHQAAVVAFPLGTALGGAWYAMFPPSPSLALIAGVTGTLVVVSSLIAAFAGIVADPVQRTLGIHRRRLDRFVRAVGEDLAGEGPSRFKVRAHYVARLFDFFDAVRLAVRVAT